jgi:integrase
MYATLLGLIAATGIRIAEALALQLDDVTTDGLVIRESKFRKSRLLPLHATTRRALDRYLIVRREAGADRALFISGTGKSPHYNSVRGVFLHLLDRTKLRKANAGRDPRIHDLRHTFAVRSLEQCRHEPSAVGAAPARRHPAHGKCAAHPSYLTKLRYDARASVSLGDSLPAMRGIGGLAAT